MARWKSVGLILGTIFQPEGPCLIFYSTVAYEHYVANGGDVGKSIDVDMGLVVIA